MSSYKHYYTIWAHRMLTGVSLLLQASVARPKIPADLGGKVPTAIRQRYLDHFCTELLKVYPGDEAQAYKKVSSPPPPQPLCVRCAGCVAVLMFVTLLSLVLDPRSSVLSGPPR